MWELIWSKLKKLEAAISNGGSGDSAGTYFVDMTAHNIPINWETASLIPTDGSAVSITKEQFDAISDAVTAKKSIILVDDSVSPLRIPTTTVFSQDVDGGKRILAVALSMDTIVKMVFAGMPESGTYMIMFMDESA